MLSAFVSYKFQSHFRFYMYVLYTNIKVSMCCRMTDHEEPHRKKVRGKGQLSFLKDLKDGQKIQVEIYNGQPSGENRAKLAHYIGYLARDGHMLPLSVSNWKYMSPTRIQRVMDEVKVFKAVQCLFTLKNLFFLAICM